MENLEMEWNVMPDILPATGVYFNPLLHKTSFFYLSTGACKLATRACEGLQNVLQSINVHPVHNKSSSILLVPLTTKIRGQEVVAVAISTSHFSCAQPICPGLNEGNIFFQK